MSALFTSLSPLRPPPGIDLRCCDVAEVLREARGATLIHADPPWLYAREAGMANPETNEIYAGLSEAEIATHLDQSYDCAENARLVCWYTWPKDEEWRNGGHAGPRWDRRVTGGAWVKTAGVGVGYHWRGQSEPIAIFTKGVTGRSRTVLLNEHRSAPGEHSEKPLDWLRAMVRAWTDPGDLVLDLYAGLAPMARACLLEGRRYIGAEIDPERHGRAVARLRGCV